MVSLTHGQSDLAYLQIRTTLNSWPHTQTKHQIGGSAEKEGQHGARPVLADALGGEQDRPSSTWFFCLMLHNYRRIARKQRSPRPSRR